MTKLGLQCSNAFRFICYKRIKDVTTAFRTNNFISNWVAKAMKCCRYIKTDSSFYCNSSLILCESTLSDFDDPNATEIPKAFAIVFLK